MDITPLTHALNAWQINRTAARRTDALGIDSPLASQGQRQLSSLIEQVRATSDLVTITGYALELEQLLDAGARGKLVTFAVEIVGAQMITRSAEMARSEAFATNGSITHSVDNVLKSAEALAQRIERAALRGSPLSDADTIDDIDAIFDPLTSANA